MSEFEQPVQRRFDLAITGLELNVLLAIIVAAWDRIEGADKASPGQRFLTDLSTLHVKVCDLQEQIFGRHFKTD